MKKILIIFVSIFTLVGCDRVSKIQAVDLLKGQDAISFLGGLFKFTYYENNGARF